MLVSRTRIVLLLGASACLLALFFAALHFYIDVGEQRVNVRWAPSVTDDARLNLERRFGLIEGEPREVPTWSYRLVNRSRTNIAALVNHPLVKDTHYIDRSAFRVELDRPDLPEWVRALAERERLDLLAWLSALAGVVLTVSGLRRLDRAGTAIARHAARVGGLVIAAVLAIIVVHDPWQLYSPRSLSLAVMMVAVFFVSRACLARWARTDRWQGRDRDGWSYVGALAGFAGLSLAFAVVFCWPLLGRLGEIGVPNDWDQHLVLHWVPYATVVEYGQIPLWNPFVCGGMPMLGNPQSRWLTPFFLLHLAFGPELGLQLEIVGHVAVAFAGAVVLGRTFGLSWVAAFAPATAFAGCSYWYLHFAEGHTTWLAYAYMPWILAAVAANRALLAGLGLALAFAEGGVYAVPHVVVALGLMTVYRFVTERSPRPLATLALAGIMAVCVAAPKVLETLPLLARYPRLIDSTEAVSLELVAQALLDPRQNFQTPVPGDAPYGFHEYGAYVGPILLVLALLGAFAPKRGALLWVLICCVTAALAVGGTLDGTFSPWALLHQLPLFASLRIPSRLLLVTVLTVGMLAGFGLDRFVRRDRGWRMAVTIALLSTATVDLLLVGPPNLQHLFDLPSVARERSSTFVQVRREDYRHMYSLARAHMGALTCYEPLRPEVFPAGVNEAGYRGEHYMLGSGHVTSVEWSPNRLRFAVVSGGPDVLVINSNYNASWQVVSGRGRTVNHEGLLGVEVPAGSQELVIAYASTRFAIGLALAIAALCLGTWVAWRRMAPH